MVEEKVSKASPTTNQPLLYTLANLSQMLDEKGCPIDNTNLLFQEIDRLFSVPVT